MSEHPASNGKIPTTRYRIVVEGGLGPRFRDAFVGFDIEPVGDDTALEGEVADQAELQGILDRIATLNLALVSVAKVAG